MPNCTLEVLKATLKIFREVKHLKNKVYRNTILDLVEEKSSWLCPVEFDSINVIYNGCHHKTEPLNKMLIKSVSLWKVHMLKWFFSFAILLKPWTYSRLSMSSCMDTINPMNQVAWWRRNKEYFLRFKFLIGFSRVSSKCYRSSCGVQLLMRMSLKYMTRNFPRYVLMTWVITHMNIQKGIHKNRWHDQAFIKRS